MAPVRITDLSPAMLRELRSIARGYISDVTDYGYNALAFYARDRVIGALAQRGLIEATPDWSLTDAGRAVIEQHARPSSVENLLTRSARKASERRFSGEAISGWGAL
jgi:hypothetical protein